MQQSRPITRRETRDRLRADHERLVAYLAEARGVSVRRATWHPSFVCVRLHRASHFHFVHGRRWLARIIWHLNLLLTGADIAEICDIGPGLLIPSPAGVSLMGRAGRNLTVMPCAGMGGEMGSRADIGAGPGMPVLGDDVTIGAHAGVLGPVRLGDRVVLEPCTGCVKDTPSDHVVKSAWNRLVVQRAGSGSGSERGDA